MLLIYYYFMCTFDISFGWHSPAKAWRCRVFVAVVLFRPVFGLLLLFDKPHQPASNQACCDSRSDHSIAKLKIKTESSDKSGTAKKKTWFSSPKCQFDRAIEMFYHDEWKWHGSVLESNWGLQYIWRKCIRNQICGCRPGNGSAMADGTHSYIANMLALHKLESITAHSTLFPFSFICFSCSISVHRNGHSHTIYLLLARIQLCRISLRTGCCCCFGGSVRSNNNINYDKSI